MQDSTNQPDFEENARILDRLREVKGWKSYGMNRKIAEFLGVSETVVSNWKSRSPIDLHLLLEKLPADDYMYVTRGHRFGKVPDANKPDFEALLLQEDAPTPGYAFRQASIAGPTERDLWLAEQVVENSLRGRSLFAQVSADERKYLSDHLARGLANGESLESLQRGLSVALDLVEKAYRKAHE